jgi:hypothetical protein
MLHFETKLGKKKRGRVFLECSTQDEHDKEMKLLSAPIVSCLFLHDANLLFIYIWVTYVMRCGVHWCSCCFLTLTKPWRLLQLKRYLVPCQWGSHVIVRRKKQIYFFFCLETNLLHVVFGAKHGELLCCFVLFYFICL